MHRLLRALLWLLIAGCLFVPAFPDPPLQSGAYVQRVTRSAAVVAKIEPTPSRLSLTVWRARGEGQGEVVCREPLSPPRRRHAFVVDGLQPGTRYRYELRDDNEQVAARGRFRTAPAGDEEPFRFAVVGDSGGQPWWVWLQNDPLFWAAARYRLLPPRAEPAAIGALMAASAPDLWLHVGDVVYPRGEQRHYGPGFFLPFAELLRTSPCYVALGNHDVMQDDGRQCLANFVLPENDSTGDERFFTFAFGPVRFAALDLNDFGAQPDDVAATFVERAFAETGEPWRVVFAHYPIFSASRQGDREDLIRGMLPALRRQGVDLMFVGHDHNYQRFGKPSELAPGEPLIVVTGGGGKSLYELRVHPKVTETYCGYHFCRVDVAGPVIRAEAIGVGGEVVDTFSLHLRTRAAARGSADASDARARRIRALLE